MKKTSTNDGTRCNIVILSITIVFIAIIVIIGVCVRFFVEGKVQQIILITLICILLVMGMAAVITLELRRRKNLKRKNKTEVRTLNGKSYMATPSAPPASHKSNTWNYKQSYSNRTTAPAEP